MNLLNGKLYDPATAVNKVTTAALAMTALDTTNLRLLFTVPASGIARVVLRGTIHGATTFPAILLGVMDGAVVKGRQAPLQVFSNVATAIAHVVADFLVTGLTPGTATTWDAAYGVETLVAATGLKYGGPNNATANDAWGGFAFEIWDPCDEYTPAANGVPPTTATRTILPTALVGGRMDSSVGAMAANVLTAAAINAAALNGKGDWNIGKTGYALTAAEYIALVNLVWDELTTEGRVASSYGQLFKDNLNAAISSRAAPGAAMDLVVDAVDALALSTDAVDEIWNAAFAELPQAAPSATPTARAAIMLMYMMARNASKSTSTERRILNASGTVIAKAPMSDDGTTFDQGGLVSGP